MILQKRSEEEVLQLQFLKSNKIFKQKTIKKGKIMKTKGLFIITSLCMWFMLAGALSVNAKEGFHHIEINNNTNKNIDVSLKDGPTFNLSAGRYQSQIIQNGFMPEFTVEIKSSQFDDYKGKFTFKGTEKVVKDIELERKKDVVGVPEETGNIKMTIDSNDKFDVKTLIKAGSYHDLGNGTVKITFDNVPQGKK